MQMVANYLEIAQSNGKDIEMPLEFASFFSNTSIDKNKVKFILTTMRQTKSRPEADAMFLFSMCIIDNS